MSLISWKAIERQPDSDSALRGLRGAPLYQCKLLNDSQVQTVHYGDYVEFPYIIESFLAAAIST